MNIISVTISNIHPRGFAFGVTDDGDQVFIPPHINNGAMKIGDKVTSQVVINPNEEQRKNTKFLAVVLGGDEPTKPPAAAEPVGTAALDQSVLNVIYGSYFMTTAQIAGELDIDPKTVGNSAMRLFNAGKIAKAEVYAKVGQSRASFLMWAEQASDFVVED